MAELDLLRLMSTLRLVFSASATLVERGWHLKCGIVFLVPDHDC